MLFCIIIKMIIETHLEQASHSLLLHHPRQEDLPGEGRETASLVEARGTVAVTVDADDGALPTAHLMDEIGRTSPLSIVMAEKIRALRSWAAQRTVPAD